jgi:formylglycine-generating enzyme required for sulfatase activity
MWSKRSVESRYVKDEATYALNRKKLVPVAIEKVEVPFRFEGLHTPNLLAWDGADESSEFRNLVEDISELLGPPTAGHPKRVEPGTVFRDKLKDGSQGPEMVVISPGTFRMGYVDGIGCERPVHIVRILKPFAIGRYEVTFEEYDRFAGAIGRKLPNDEGWGRAQRPVINVSWGDALASTEWLSVQTSKYYRLPHRG